MDKPRLPSVPVDQATIDAVARTGVEYTPCPAPVSSFYLLTRAGRDEPWRTDDQEAVVEALAREGVAHPTVGTCICPSAKTKTCAKVVVQATEEPVAPTFFAARLATAGKTRGLEALSLRLEVEIGLPLDWRCLPGDPTCGPLPYNPTTCPEDIYHAGRPRQPIDGPCRGACRHDGECAVVGCAKACGPARETRSDESACVGGGRTHLPERPLIDSLCGCVGGRCTWFVERT
jgi:hypothetical protein